MLWTYPDQHPIIEGNKWQPISEMTEVDETIDPNAPRVGLFVTCIADLYRPNVGFAALYLLEEAGCRVDVPLGQTCCGQPAWNSGDQDSACIVAKTVIKSFEPYPYIVAPSGSCSGMIRIHYPKLFATDSKWRARAEAVAGRCYELTSFLTDVLGVDAVSARYEGSVTYHDSCSGLREMGVREQPRHLLKSVDGLELRELDERDACCGFGGAFSVKYPDISGRLVSDKCADIASTQADTVLGGDLGCLLNIAGRLRREGKHTRVFHVAEVLADMTDLPGVGEDDTS